MSVIVTLVPASTEADFRFLVGSENRGIRSLAKDKFRGQPGPEEHFFL
jgi:hypothetical protein